jgi:glucose/mannose-6-phosphate isomerase
VLLEYSVFKKYDPQEMHKFYDEWPRIAKESFESKFDCGNFKKTNHIVFAGMGGSGTIGDIFSALLSKTSIHVNVVKGYVLPQTVNSETLVIVTSVSGNTSETLSILDSANKKGCDIVAFSSGGIMKDYCLKNKIKYVMIKKCHSPRTSLISYLYSMLKVLEKPININIEDIIESIKVLDELNKKINSSNLSDSNPSLKLANWISEIPIIYFPFGLESAATRFKNSLQENAKMHVMKEDVIEACHNGIVSWERESIVKPILLQGIDDNIKTKERYKIIKEFFKEKHIEFFEIYSNKGSILSKLIYLIYLLDYATIYCSILTKTDPSPVKPIDYLKNKNKNIFFI